MVETAQALSQTSSDKQQFDIYFKRKQPYHKPSGKRKKTIAQKPQRYQCPEGHAVMILEIVAIFIMQV